MASLFKSLIGLFVKAPALTDAERLRKEIDAEWEALRIALED